MGEKVWFSCTDVIPRKKLAKREGKYEYYFLTIHFVCNTAPKKIELESCGTT